MSIAERAISSFIALKTRFWSPSRKQKTRWGPQPHAPVSCPAAESQRSVFLPLVVVTVSASLAVVLHTATVVLRSQYGDTSTVCSQSSFRTREERSTFRPPRSVSSRCAYAGDCM